jgi:hypothetical protein
MGKEVYEKWGFGLAPPKPQMEAKRQKWAEQVLNILERPDDQTMLQADLGAISEVKGLFNRVVRQDQWDWFSVAVQLGYPSTRISEAIALSLNGLRTGIRDSDLETAKLARSTLRRLPTRKCLAVFLKKVRIADEDNAGWVYILSTRELPELLKIGMTTRTVEQRTREINTATGVAIPFGVRACWRVHSPSAAEKIVHAALADARIRGDREFFRIEYSIAKKRIIDELMRCVLKFALSTT